MKRKPVVAKKAPRVKKLKPIRIVGHVNFDGTNDYVEASLGPLVEAQAVAYLRANPKKRAWRYVEVGIHHSWHIYAIRKGFKPRVNVLNN